VLVRPLRLFNVGGMCFIMDEFIWHLRCMISARKYRKEHETMENQYQWYKYLVICEIHSFFSRFRFWKRKGDLPF
jgi:hypothetical protein